VSCTPWMTAPAGTFPAISNARSARRGELVPLVPAKRPLPPPLELSTLFWKMVTSLLAPIEIESAEAESAVSATIAIAKAMFFIMGVWGCGGLRRGRRPMVIGNGPADIGPMRIADAAADVIG